MPKILIVEDDKPIAMALGVRVKTQGHQAIFAHDAMGGVQMAVREKPDLILLDITMPAGGGFTVAERVRNMMPIAATPIIFLTASKDPEICQKAQAYDPVAFLEKPYDAEKLLAIIAEALGSPV